MSRFPNCDLLTMARSGPLPHDLAISDNDLYAMFINILRDPALLRSACQQLKQDAFPTTSEPHWRFLWGVVLEYMGQYGDMHLPTVCQIVAARLPLVAELSPAQANLLLSRDQNCFLGQCQSVPATELNPAYAQEVLIRFLHQRTVIDPFKANLGANGTYPQNSTALISAALEEARIIEGLRARPISMPMPEFGSPLRPPDVYVPSGISFIDSFIVGQRPGDCNGILGGLGSGKTTLCLQLSVANARHLSHSAMEAGTPAKLSVMFTYEEPEAKLIKRVQANAAYIRHSKLAAMRSWDELTRPDNRESYELWLPPEALLAGNCERERWASTRIWLNDTYVLIDLSGGGAGLVNEVVGILSRLRSERNREIGAVHIDYAKIMCQRHIVATNKKDESIRFLLGALGDQLRSEVAERFGCTVWLMHQIAADQNKKSPTTPLDHADASEAKAFAEHMAVCGCLGMPDRTTGCRLLNWSKIRYAPGGVAAPPVLQIDGEFCRLIDVSDRYVPDAHSRTFIDPETRYQFEGAERRSSRPTLQVDDWN